jgi:hypothetical protein
MILPLPSILLVIRHLRVMQAVLSKMKLAGADNPAAALARCHGEGPS